MPPACRCELRPLLCYYSRNLDKKKKKKKKKEKRKKEKKRAEFNLLLMATCNPGHS